MRPRGKIVGVENVPRTVLYNVGHFKVSLTFQPEIPKYEIVKN